MADIAQVAQRFFEACEAGKGWEVCSAYCHPNASFSAQAEPLAETRDISRLHRLDERPAQFYA